MNISPYQRRTNKLAAKPTAKPKTTTPAEARAANVAEEYGDPSKAPQLDVLRVALGDAAGRIGIEPGRAENIIARFLFSVGDAVELERELSGLLRSAVRSGAFAAHALAVDNVARSWLAMREAPKAAEVLEPTQEQAAAASGDPVAFPMPGPALGTVP